MDILRHGDSVLVGDKALAAAAAARLRAAAAQSP